MLTVFVLVCVLQSFVEEVVAHQADLRYITMCANRFTDMAKVCLSGRFSVAVLLDYSLLTYCFC